MDMLGGQRVEKCRVVPVGCMGVPRYRMARWKSSLTGISCGGHLRFVGASVVSWSGSIGVRRLARTRASSPVRCLTSRGRDQPSA